MHFDSLYLTCVHPEILQPERVVDPDESRECPHYKSGLGAAKPSKTLVGVSIFTWTTILTVIVIFALLFIGLSRYTIVGPTETILQLRIYSVGTVVSDEPFDLIFGIYNRGKRPARHVTLHLGRRTLWVAELVDVDPPVEEIYERGDSIFLDFGDLEAGESILGTLTFKALRTGEYPIKTTLSADNSARPQSAEKRVRIAP
ncbi:MAG: hypothetical protein GTO55_02045 [Armatimonadetes bacterium]|nr:hypothetical protein [Armatimonadota bacterium]NIM23060.1 hypothetical protein [Armatimonadota bacterium]NIM66928.1 hypothetical protein [Armatimonadota bacterium]NIM75462.1 hypothetical protein [Armatimonadota bacterium]NIN05119.1 hypothetical protein [Armatimonadota bacterium]